MNLVLRYLLGVLIVVNALPANAQIAQIHVGVIPAGDSIVFKKRTKINSNITAPAVIKNQFILLKQDGADTLKSDDPKTLLLNDSTATHVYHFPRVHLTDSIIQLKEQSKTLISTVSIDTGLTIAHSFPLKRIGFAFVEGFISSQDTIIFKPDRTSADQYQHEIVQDTFFIIPRLPAQQLTKTQWENAARSVFFGNKSSRPDTSVRKLSIWIEDSLLKSEEVFLSIKVNAVNNQPNISGDTTSLVYKEPVDALLVPTYIIIDSILQVTDPDSDTLKHIQIMIENYRSGEDSLIVQNYTLNDKVQLSFDPLKGEVNIHSTNILSNTAYWEQLLRKLSYVNFSDHPDTARRTISIRIIDGLDTSAHYKRHIIIKPSNDSPFIKGALEAAHFIEPKLHTAASAILVDSLMAINDKDDWMMKSAAVQIENFKIGQDTLYFSVDNSMTDSVDIHLDTLGTLSIAARYESVSKERLQNLLQKLTYLNTSKWPDTAARTLSYQINDGKENSVFFKKMLTISPLNNEPVLTGTVNTLLFTVKANREDAELILDPTVDIIDHDDSLLTSATVAIVNFKKQQDSLFLNSSFSTDSVNIQFDETTGLLKISSVGAGISVRSMCKILKSVTYTNTSSQPDTTQRIFQLQVRDFSANSNPVFYYMSVRVLNRSPRFVKKEYERVKICSGVQISLDTMLRVYDTDIGQHLTFQVLRAKGEISSFSDNVQTNGGIVKPVSVYYHSMLNFSGTDTLVIRVTDSFFESDTVKITLQVDEIPKKEDAKILGDSVICINEKKSSIYTLINTQQSAISWQFINSGVLLSEMGKTVVLTFNDSSKSGLLRATLHNECGISDPIEKYVHIRYPISFSHKIIAGRDSVCAGEKNIEFTVEEIKDYRYYWYSNVKDLILRPNHNKVFVDIGKNVGKGIIAVVITDSCGNNDTITHKINIGKSPDQIGKITAGKNIICSSDTVLFQVPANFSVVYHWSYSGSKVLFSDSLYKVSIGFNEYSTDGELSVTASNFCGTTKPVFFAVEIHKKPVQPLMSATALAVDAGQQNVVYEILNWVDKCDYSWTYSGIGIQIIKQKPYLLLSFSDTAQSGVFKLSAQNACYSTPASPVDIEVSNPRVELDYFGVQIDGKKVLGNVKTRSEHLIDKYEVHHSADDAVYVKIADMEAGLTPRLLLEEGKAKPTPGFNDVSAYTFLHKNPVHGSNYYKLLFQSKNGFKYQLGKQILQIDTTQKTGKLTFYPNPFTNIIYLICKEIPADDYQLHLYDFRGAIVFSKRININQTDLIKKVVINRVLVKGNYYLLFESRRNRFGNILVKQ